MSKRSADDYANALFESVKIISESLLEGLKYDRTVEATIIDDNQREQGIYVVSDGSTRFKVFSENTKYRKNNVVYITIPNGDFDNDKIITGKKMKSDETEPFIYNSPFSNLIDVSGNLIGDNIGGGLVANLPNVYYEPYYGEVDNYEQYFIKVENSEGIYEYITAPDQYQDQYYTQKTGGLSKNIGYKEFSTPYYNFTRLGISAEFQVWLMEQNCISGNYGLKVSITFAPETSLEENNYESVTRELYLDVADMVGNPYQFETYYIQEKLFDISTFGGITKIVVDFFQDAGSFTDKKGNFISYLDEFDNIVLPNLFVRNCRICVGYDADSFDEDFVKLYSFSPQTYTSSVSKEENQKEIKLLWVHLLENEEQVSMSKDSQEQFEIRWYRYLLGEPSADVYCGAGWTNTNHERNKDVFKVDENDSFKAILHPDGGLIAVERIKAIVLFGKAPAEGEPDNRKIYYTEPIEFINEKDVISGATLDAIQALTLICMDEEDGKVKNSYGNYLIYDQGNTLIDRGQSQITRLIGCKLDLASTAEEDTAALVEATSITWKFPLANTMINPIDYEDSEQSYGEIIITDQVEINNQIKKYGCPVFKYTIATNYSPTKANNFIECSVLKDGITYHAVKELTFGQSSTSGTEWTFVIDFDKNVNAVLANTNAEYGLTARLYDSAGQELDISDKQIKWGFLDPNNSSKLVENSGNTIGMQLSDSTNNKQTLTTGINLDINSLFIVSATLEGWGDYELTAFLPVPIRLNDNYLYVSGATSIIYLTDGAPIYYNKFYELHTKTENLTNQVKWERYYNSGIDESIEMYFPEVAPQIDTNKVIIGYKLKPVSMYVKELPIMSVQCKDISGVVLWNQPLLIVQNRYPSAMINQWDGKELVMNKDKGAILANMIGAGKKENDNSFTGVLMGDWQQNSANGSVLYNKVGLYGFQNGEMSFSFSEDGNATIGKASGSQLKFDGNNSIITSGSYKGGAGTGMLLDFDNNQILAKINGKDIFRLDDTEPYLRINNTNNQTLLYVGDSNYYLRSAEYNFSNLNDSNPAKGTEINLNSGNIKAARGNFYGDIIIQNNDGSDFEYETYSASGGVVSDSGKQYLSSISLKSIITRLLSNVSRAQATGYAASQNASAAAAAAASAKSAADAAASAARTANAAAAAANSTATTASNLITTLNRYFGLGVGSTGTATTTTVQMGIGGNSIAVSAYGIRLGSGAACDSSGIWTINGYTINRLVQMINSKADANHSH